MGCIEGPPATNVGYVLAAVSINNNTCVVTGKKFNDKANQDVTTYGDEVTHCKEYYRQERSQP